MSLAGESLAVEARLTDLGYSPDQVLRLHDAVDDEQLAQELGAACRQSPRGVCVWCSFSERAAELPAERFFALGFRRVFTTIEGACRHVVYEFRLADYKQPPDWLNARFWAHPERFDLDPDELASDNGVHP